MSLLLHIDTALERASICLSKDKEIVGLMVNENQQDHASWLHPAIQEIILNNGYKINELNAVSVSIGPGSYTGLRVGLSAAKGFCYALNIPLITIGTLEMIAFAAKEEAVDLICPAIDARRMEIFTSVYNKQLVEIKPAHALVINENIFDELLHSTPLLFCGNSNKKIQSLISNKNATFSNKVADASHLAQLAHHKFVQGNFANIAYTEPFYVKEFYVPNRKD